MKQHMTTYVQINIYNTTIKKLREQGVDIKRILENTESYSIIMDIPNFQDVPVDSNVHKMQNSASSINNFSSQIDDMHPDNSSWYSVPEHTTSPNEHAKVAGDSAMDETASHHEVVRGNLMHTPLTSLSQPSATLSENGGICLQTPLTSTPLPSKCSDSFRSFVYSPGHSMTESLNTSLHCTSGVDENNHGFDGERTEHSHQKEPSTFSTGNISIETSVDNMTLKSTILAVNVSVVPDCRGNFAHASADGENTNAPMIPHELLNGTTSQLTPSIEQNSSVLGLTPGISHKGQYIEIDTTDTNAMLELSFTDFSRDVMQGLQSMSVPLYPNENTIRDNIGQPCRGINNTSELWELLPLNEFDYFESPAAENFAYSEQEFLFYRTPEAEQIIYDGVVEQRNNVAVEERVLEEIDGSAVMPPSALMLSVQNSSDSFSTSCLSFDTVSSNQPCIADSGFQHVSDDGNPSITKQAVTSEKKTRKKRAQPSARICSEVTNKSKKTRGKFDNGGSSANSFNSEQSFQCHMPGCGKNISWRPRYGKNRLVDHVRVHWGKAVKKCKLCEYKASSNRKINHHHKTKHGDLPYVGTISLETRDDLEELVTLWGQCFPGHSSSGTIKWMMAANAI